jgi:hypothetical protein
MSSCILEILANGQKRRIATLPNYREAEAAARAAFFPICFDVDQDHIGCADFMACDGRLYVIEPEGFHHVA